MLLILGILLIGAVVFQWFTQEVTVKIWGPWRVSFYRDDWPAFFWITMGLECGLSVLLIYWYFA